MHVNLHLDRRNNGTEAQKLNRTQKYVLAEHSISS